MANQIGTKTMKVAVEQWTPERAQAVLDNHETGESVAQRRRRQGMVARYVRDMKAGQWALTHQAIALGPNGEMVDGQHRLAAIVQSGTTQDMLTVRYTTTAAALTALAATDIGGKRTVAETLTISGVLGAEGARDIVAMVTALRSLVDPTSRTDSTPQEVKATFDEYATHIAWAAGALPRKGFAAPLRAAFAFAHQVFPAETEEFATMVASGEAPRGSAAQAWVRLSRDGRLTFIGGSAIRVRVMMRALRLIRAHITGEGDLQKVYDTPRESLDWFKTKMKRKPVVVALANAA